MFILCRTSIVIRLFLEICLVRFGNAFSTDFNRLVVCISFDERFELLVYFGFISQSADDSMSLVHAFQAVEENHESSKSKEEADYKNAIYVDRYFSLT